MSSPCQHIPSGSDSLVYDGRLYTCRLDRGDSSQLRLAMYQPGWPEEYHVSLLNLATFPQSHHSYNAKFFLLIKDDHESMSVLLPPDSKKKIYYAEIKKIRLTWAQARAELNRLWEEKYGTRDYESFKRVRV